MSTPKDGGDNPPPRPEVLSPPVSVAELVARRFHAHTMTLAPRYGLTTPAPWAHLSPSERGAQIATAAGVLADLGALGLHVRLEGGEPKAALPKVNGTAPKVNGTAPKVNGTAPRGKDHVCTADDCCPAPSRGKGKAAKLAVAREQGFEGVECANPECGAMKVKRNGACLLCTACGESTGCS